MSTIMNNGGFITIYDDKNEMSTGISIELIREFSASFDEKRNRGIITISIDINNKLYSDSGWCTDSFMFFSKDRYNIAYQTLKDKLGVICQL